MVILLVSVGTLALSVALAGPRGSHAQVEAPAQAGQGPTNEQERPAEADTFDWVEELLPSYLVEVHFLDLALWQWLGALVLLLTASFVGFFAALFVIKLLRLVLRRVQVEWPGMIIKALAGPLRLMLSIWFFLLGVAALLQLPSRALSFVATTCEVLAVLTATWFTLRLVDVGVSRGVPAALTLVPMGVRMTKVFLALIALLSLVNHLGFNVASILAGLGVGGLAIALALQKPLENLFSGITVITDQPVKVGDFCRVGEHMGTVEDVGLRATRLRTLDRTLLSIPNSEFASARIENFTARDKIRFAHILSFGYDTSPDQMRYVLTRMREILSAHPKVDPIPCRVRFMRYGAFSLDVELFAFVKTTDFNEYLAVQEDLFLHIYDAVQESGASFAFPSQTLYLGRDPGRDPERTQAAEEHVRAWREAQQLPFPDVAPARITELDDSLPWPPEGAPRPTAPVADGATPSNPKERGRGKGWWR